MFPTKLNETVICRPKLCLEKCDANLSKLSKPMEVSSILSEWESEPDQESNTNTQSNSNRIQEVSKVPEKYRHLIKMSPIVKLTKFNNIDDMMKATNLPPSATKL